ncbi:ABC transporter ATP-binding protein [Candidatus Aerophobetes bacterium]|uniref:ABC transporter ATP-binding protein n=1 Tax=Aerophobetes bacterium TaxID=2030807 RepID=A0A662DG79_UNCAE|nr:ABC transporter ATP-binding protein [Candidatus Aerophobetes bacterium]RLE13888.1 MAG: ABC transporter ATP-binding protein [Candidatus Aerophobetes bacterium]
MLEIRELEKRFGGVKAVDRCSLRVEEGSITGLIGPNGAGKTTLFNLISGLYKPDGGEIWFMGDRIDGLPSHEIARKSISRTFQIPREFKEMTVLENLMLVPKNQIGENIFNSLFRSRLVKMQEKENMEKALKILEFLELIDLKDEYAKNLSSGQKKLLELAKILMSDPRVILLDEPGAGVNRTLMKKLVKSIEELRDRGMTFFLIEHDMDLVTYLCDRVIVMNKGKKMTEGTPEEIKKDKQVLEAYLGV